MKTKRNVFPEKISKKSKRRTNSIFLICCSLFFFLVSRCLPDQQTSYAKLLTLLLLTSNKSLSSENQSPIDSDPVTSNSPEDPGSENPGLIGLGPANPNSPEGPGPEDPDPSSSDSVSSGSSSPSPSSSDSVSSGSSSPSSTSSGSVSSGSSSPSPSSSGSVSSGSSSQSPSSSGSVSSGSSSPSSTSSGSVSSGSSSPSSTSSGIVINSGPRPLSTSTGVGSITSIEISSGPYPSRPSPTSPGIGSISIVETIGSGRPSSGRTYSNPQNLEVKILSHNVSLMPTQLPGWADWGQKERAEQIASSDYIKNQDVIVFESLSDPNTRKILLDGIRSQYPYQTDAVGRTRSGWNATLGTYRQSTSADGGVVIVSQWPIEEKVQYIFNNPGCGAESSYNRGFTYVRINKNGKKFHVIGTQVQTVGPACSDLGRSARRSQFGNIKDFINTKTIPADELVLIAGDMNVTRGSIEYYEMLTNLNVSEPKYAGIPFTQDPKVNSFTALKRSGSEPVYTNYVLVSKSYFQPQVWQNLAYDPISPKIWERSNGHISYELSDSYPVYGFVYADSTTPTKSGHKRKYDQVSFVSLSRGTRIQANSKKPNGWLKADATTETEFTKFNLVQPSDPNSNPFCMESGYVQIEPSAYLNYFWNWWYSGGFAGGHGNYAYYPKFDDGSNRIQIINLDGGCLRDGSKITFKDYNTILAQQQYLTVWNEGPWNQYLFLWSSRVVNETMFYLKLDSTPARDWHADLIYR
ncbi:sphingomyelin phosphodiesterase [Leptospira santarosai]|uniref:sphingomyelin phosphodiesterase n=1 Tax=Leptospira santarosai TaxID=28183 RepID=UPI0024AF244B|nr:sphingomyelin phosphodiesterase [Leptospira santarosai]MDI7215982.1 sphingomyelin phosphodiesterase [Leptospira santarosai]MDI7216015.1 sphingomyelin phosphodiesterase [Leptospira santarosai]